MTDEPASERQDVQSPVPPQVPPDGPPPEARDAEPGKPSRGGMVFGILLVAAGVLFLVGRFIPWLSITQAWPLIIIALGLARAFRGRDAIGVLDGATTVVIGGILLANTTGVLPWGAWGSILSLWPLLLVSAGVAIIAQAISQPWLRIVAQLIVIAGLLYGAILMPAPAWSFPPFTTSIASGPTASFEEKLTWPGGETTTTAGTASINWGGAAINVLDGTTVAEISGRAPERAQPELTGTRRDDGSVDVTVGRESVAGAGADGRLDVWLGRDVAWKEVAVHAGGASGKIDLSGLDVRRASVNTGATSMSLVIGEKAPRVSVDVNMGVADLTLRVPKGAFVSVGVQGLVTSSMPAGFRSVSGGPVDGRWEGGPSGAPVRIEVLVKGGIANLDVETY